MREKTGDGRPKSGDGSELIMIVTKIQQIASVAKKAPLPTGRQARNDVYKKIRNEKFPAESRRFKIRRLALKN